MMRQKNKGTRCSEPGCQSEGYALGLCHVHYHAARRGQSGANQSTNGTDDAGVKNSEWDHGIKAGKYLDHAVTVAADVLSRDFGESMAKWVLESFRLPQGEGGEGGRVTFEGYQIMEHVLGMVQNPNVKKIWLCLSAQSCKTVILFSIASFLSGRKGKVGIYAYPSDKMRKKVPKTRMIPTFKKSECGFVGTEGESIMRFENGSYIWIAGMYAPDSLAEMPAGYAIEDEIDENEAWDPDPIELIENRMTTATNPINIGASTPKRTDENGIFHRLNHSKRFVLQQKCPHCENWFRSRFPDTFRWVENKTWQEIESEKLGWIECPECNGMITDDYHIDIVRNGQRVFDLDPDLPITEIGYHGRRWETRWKSYSQVCAKYVQVKDDPNKLKDFWNSWCAEPRDNSIKGVAVNYNKLRGTYLRDQKQIPAWAQWVTGGVDIGKDHLWLVLRAWGEGNRVAPFWSVKIGSDLSGEEGILDSLSKLDEATKMSNFTFLGQGTFKNPEFAIGMIDCGHATDVIYDFCRESGGVWCPAKGGGPSRLWEMRAADPENRKHGRYHGLYFYFHNSHRLQETLQMRLETAAGGPGSYEFAQDEGRRLFQHFDAVVRKEKFENGKVKVTWGKRNAMSADHLRDADANAELAGRVVGAEALGPQIPLSQMQKNISISEDIEDNDFGQSYTRA